ncbi:cell wall anchor protein [Peribacillus sp. SCS-155]|uniref:cell wall anchor protein n=1 Tax=Peribacillus sedimenti TaxID=3115297 RepID=UPI0039059376
MLLKQSFKKGTAIIALSTGLSLFALSPSTPAFAAQTSPAQQLVDSLEALNLDHVDYLYSYLQSIDLSKKELTQINQNTQRANQIIKKTNNVEDLTTAQKAEIVRLFMDNVKLAHLDVTFVDDQGRALSIADLKDYEPGTTGLQLQIKDLNGNLLATLDPTLEDLSSVAILAKINAFKKGVDAKEQLEAEGKFVPMPSATLPKTATDNPTYIAIGGMLILLGTAGLMPAIARSRKSLES